MGVITVSVYLTIVVVTTPSLRPVDAITISISQNWWLVGAIAVGAGIQAFLLAYAKDKACPVRYKGTIIGASGFFSGLSSFLSFLSLIPVGCCGTWIYVLAFLPGLIGTSASGFLIRNGLQFEFLGLVLMTLSVAYTYLSVKKRLAVLKTSGLRTSPKMQSLITLILITAAAIGSVVFTLHQANFQPQLFRGAYAMYSGTALFSGAGPINTTRTYKILDFNSTSVETQITTRLGAAQFQSTVWEPYSLFDRLHNNGEVLVREYATNKLISGKTYPNLIADEYAARNSTTTYYYNSLIATFPIQIVTSSGAFTVDLRLVSTNQD